MAGIKQIEMKLEGLNDLALIGANDAIWLVVPLRWWDLATLLWWVFVPVDKKATVHLTLGDGSKVKVRAVRVATKHVRVRGFQ